MCLAMPTRVLTIGEDGRGTVELGGVELAISLEMVEGVAVGDYVIIHVGHAIAKLDPIEAEKTLAFFAELEAQS